MENQYTNNEYNMNEQSNYINHNNEIEKVYFDKKNKFKWYMDNIRSFIIFQFITLFIIIILSFIMYFLWNIVYANNSDQYVAMDVFEKARIAIIVFLSLFCFFYFVLNIIIVSKIISINWNDYEINDFKMIYAIISLLLLTIFANLLFYFVAKNKLNLYK